MNPAKHSAHWSDVPAKPKQLVGLLMGFVDARPLVGGLLPLAAHNGVRRSGTALHNMFDGSCRLCSGCWINAEPPDCGNGPYSPLKGKDTCWLGY
jgi:hypothetical protein